MDIQSRMKEFISKFTAAIRSKEIKMSEKKRVVILAILLFSFIAFITAYLPRLFGVPGAITMFVILVALYYVISEFYLRRRLYGGNY